MTLSLVSHGRVVIILDGETVLSERPLAGPLPGHELVSNRMMVQIGAAAWLLLREEICLAGPTFPALRPAH